MVERRQLKRTGTNGQEFVEFLFTPYGLQVIDTTNTEESLKRRLNRERIARQQELPMSSIIGRFNEQAVQQEGVDFRAVNNRRERRTRGKGRKINPKQ